MQDTPVCGKPYHVIIEIKWCPILFTATNLTIPTIVN